jgi:hypothetical protein
MRTMKLALNLVIAAVLSAGVLTACGSKKGGSGAASTPGSSCTYNYQTGYYSDSQGRYCNGTSTQNCQSMGYTYYNGHWYNSSNHIVTCSGGSSWGQNSFFPNQGYSNTGNWVDGCSGWSMYYPGNQYVPINVGGGQIVCANVAYINQYYSGFQQQYNYYGANYFQQNPMYWGQTNPYNYGGYNQCSTSLGISFGSDNFSAGGYLCL